MDTAEAKKVILGAIVLEARRRSEPLHPDDIALLNSNLAEAEAIEDRMLEQEGDGNHVQEFEEKYAVFLNGALQAANPTERAVILRAVRKLSKSREFLVLVVRHVSPELLSAASSVQITIVIAILLLAVYVLLMMLARVYGT